MAVQEAHRIAKQQLAAHDPRQPHLELQLGSVGQRVEEAQTYLKALRLYHGEVDGIFGPETRGAVLELQRRAGIERDGIIGKDTWRVLHERVGALPQPPDANAVRDARQQITPHPNQQQQIAKPGQAERSQDLSRGAQGEYVKAMQRLLTN